jgi:hypothetical protein
MVPRSTIAVPLALAGALAVAAGGSAAGRARALDQSPELWATVDVCNTPHHPNTIGIRGSMPTDGHPRDIMYMRFLVQSLDTATNQWADLGKSADSGFVRIGSAASTRQAGRSFEFKPTTTTYTTCQPPHHRRAYEPRGSGTEGIQRRHLHDQLTPSPPDQGTLAAGPGLS